MIVVIFAQLQKTSIFCNIEICYKNNLTNYKFYGIPDSMVKLKQLNGCI